MDKVLKNEEIKDMINAFGCGVGEGYGNDFDINKLRYNKIIIMSDADEVKAKTLSTSPVSEIPPKFSDSDAYNLTLSDESNTATTNTSARNLFRIFINYSYKTMTFVISYLP